MITTNRVMTITRLAMPICIALSSTFVMALIDLIMVGSLGNNAVAAVGLSSYGNTLLLAFVMGISPAVLGIVARRRGENSNEIKCLPLNAGLLLAIAIGVPLSIVGIFLTPYFFSLVSTDPAVVRIGIPFLSVLYLGITAVGLNNAYRGYWTGMERPMVFMAIALLMNCLNILLNYIFIFGNFGAPVLGAQGAAVGTVISLYAGVLINTVIAYKHSSSDGFITAKPDMSLLSRIQKMSVPAAMQEFFFSAGYITFFWMVGQVGTRELAAASVLVRVTMVMVLIAMALGMASATLVSRTLGEGNPDGATEWGWDIAKLGVTIVTTMGIPLLFFPELFLSMFLIDKETIEMAVTPLRLVALTTGIGSLIYIFAATLYSVGDGKRVIAVSFATQWFFFLPAVWIVGPYMKLGLVGIWWVQMAYGCLATVLITKLWMDGRWKVVKL
ncbi:MAG: MATE family efflux transporter [Burkholderiaceae bacterium]|nr:MAG: MATE family efflux transporter [Burkholderiaceae bacterium]